MILNQKLISVYAFQNWKFLINQFNYETPQYASVAHGSPEIIKGVLMVSMGAMREVEASNIHPCP